MLKVERSTPDFDWQKPGAVPQGHSRGGLADAVVIVPPDVKRQIEAIGSAKLPILYDSTDEPSQITYAPSPRESSNSGETRSSRPPGPRPEAPRLHRADRGEGGGRRARGEVGGSIWGRIFPFLLVIMALTGAFYPAVDLCAGEKERGTMETLLISPASRPEIVLGKFFTVMLASMSTALLNLVSMGLTGLQIAGKSPRSGRGPGPRWRR